jgi:hypothetical protein
MTVVRRRGRGSRAREGCRAESSSHVLSNRGRVGAFGPAPPDFKSQFAPRPLRNS